MLGRTRDIPASSPRVADFERCFASEAAFRAFYDDALPRVYGYLVSRCHGDRALAEELTQTTMIEAVRRHHSYDGRADPVTWLIAIARHKLVDHFRAAARDERRQIRMAVTELRLDRDTETWRTADEREVLVGALGRLAPAHQAVLVLHYADGLPVREVARAIGRSEGATESLLTRAREALRAVYEEAGDA